jgi:hypothetical protein
MENMREVQSSIPDFKELKICLERQNEKTLDQILKYMAGQVKSSA